MVIKPEPLDELLQGYKSAEDLRAMPNISHN